MPEHSNEDAIVLLSGGLDSATTLAIANEEGYGIHALSFNYGQRHGVELTAARALAKQMGVLTHRVVDLTALDFGDSSLTGGQEVPMDRLPAEIDAAIPSTYVPARNTIFLAIALAHAEAMHCDDIFIGVTAVDYSGYPDCRGEFIAAFEKAGRLGTRLGALTIHAPLVALSKAEIISRGLELGVDYRLTRSCYSPDENGAGCGRCDACTLRLAGFGKLGMTDPAPYRQAV